MKQKNKKQVNNKNSNLFNPEESSYNQNNQQHEHSSNQKQS